METAAPLNQELSAIRETPEDGEPKAARPQLVGRAAASLRRFLAGEAFRVIRPVILAAAATGLLFFAVDRSQPWSIGAAILGLGLLGTVLTRQLLAILALERSVAGGLHQITLFTEVVASLNSASNVGQTLGQNM